MKFNFKLLFVVIATLLFRGVAITQIPVEVFGGYKKTTIDVMFFKYFKNKDKQNTNWLFFNRNRASIDYAMTETTNLPQFGFTEAISYNDKRLKGFAPVIVASVLNRGIYPKIGIQFAKIKTDFTVFSWVVFETMKSPNIDFFFLGRYTPKLAEKLNLFSQIELVNALPTVKKNDFTFIQRVRLGLKVKEFQFGVGVDFTAVGRTQFANARNIGGFFRYEF